MPKGYNESRDLVLDANPDPEILKAHVLMHNYKLSKDVRRRKQIHEETQSFSRLLRQKELELVEKERKRTNNLDVDAINQHCAAEEARWDRHWPGIKGDWILTSIKNSISPTPPIDFFSQSYEQAFRNHHPNFLKRAPSVIQLCSNATQQNISNFIALEKQLNEEIGSLEKELGHVTPPRNSSIRKSLPPTPNKTPSPRVNANGLKFQRSVSRLSRASSESPRINKDHGIRNNRPA